MLPSWLIILWSFMMGGAVGSFLNVVVYRLPLGISIVHPPSHCPKCGKSIAWYDNVPILGWIMLRGRCRQCQNPISARYPVVETIAAVMFTAVAVAEMRAFEPYTFFILCTYHWILLSTLLSAALIDYDGNLVPLKLYVPALIVGVVTPAVWSALSAEILYLLAGLAAGIVLGGIAWIILRRQRPVGLSMGLVTVGLFLGWPAILLIAFCAAMVECIQWIPVRMTPRSRVPASVSVAVFSLFWILFIAWVVSG